MNSKMKVFQNVPVENADAAENQTATMSDVIPDITPMTISKTGNRFRFNGFAIRICTKSDHFCYEFLYYGLWFL